MAAGGGNKLNDNIEQGQKQNACNNMQLVAFVFYLSIWHTDLN